MESDVVAAAADSQASSAAARTAATAAKSASTASTTAANKAAKDTESLTAMSPCPFAATPLPLTSDDIGADGHMTSIYLHESVVNCMFWGLHRTNALK